MLRDAAVREKDREREKDGEKRVEIILLILVTLLIRSRHERKRERGREKEKGKKEKQTHMYRGKPRRSTRGQNKQQHTDFSPHAHIPSLVFPLKCPVPFPHLFPFLSIPIT